MKTRLGVVALVLLAGAARADEKPDYSELARLIQQTLVDKAPREYEDRSHWGKTIPVPDKLPLPRLRTRIKVGDKEELPHGPWTRTKVWLDDPSKDVRLQIRDLRKLDAKTVRLSLDVTAAAHVERERKQWQKGLLLLGLTTQADVTVTADLVCDVAITLDTTPFPPAVRVEPKVVESRLGLKELELNRLGKVAFDEAAGREIGNELKGILEELLRLYEPKLKDRANEAIAQAVKEGKGKFSAAALLKLAPAGK